MKKHLLVSDYDGTFYTSDSNANLKYNIEAIKEFRKNSGIFLLNTGRSFASIKGQIRKHSIEYDYLACLDGLATYDNCDTAVSFSELDPSNDDFIEDLRRIVLLNNFQVHYLKDVYSPIVEKSFTSDRIYEREQLYTKMSKLLDKKYTKLDVHSYLFYGVFNYFIRNRGINKSNAIKAVIINEQIDPVDVFTIGDELNDLSMIKDYNGYVVSGCNRDLLEYAIDCYTQVHRLVEDISTEKVKRR